MAEVLTYGASRPSLSWRRWVVIALAGFAALHFGFSVFAWSLDIYAIVRDPRFRPGDLTYFLTTAGPCVLLLLLSCAALWMAIKRRRGASAALLLALGFSAALFWYDTSHRR